MKICVRIIIFVVIVGTPINVHAEIQDAFSPHQGATELIIRTIDKAKKSIRVAAYSFTSRPIANALVSAHGRGVSVEVVLDMKENRNHGVSGFLAQHGILTRLNGNYAIMHDKFMIIDNETLELGSFNYTFAAEKNNAENILVISGEPKLIDDYSRQWTKLWKEAE